jgi:hypothetical protein
MAGMFEGKKKRKAEKPMRKAKTGWKGLGMLV